MKLLIVNGLEWDGEYNSVAYPNNAGQWFIDAFGGDSSRFDVWRVLEEKNPPGIHYQGIVLGGSHASVYDNDLWIRRLEDYTRRWIEEGIPILGVCFGHQLIAQVAGGRVIRNPKGMELGTHAVIQTDAGRIDPLFAGLPAFFPAMQFHQDIVIELPPNAECLASSALSSIQAFRIGETIRAIQFHPEFTPNHMRYIINPCKKEFEAQGLNCDSILAGLRPTPESRAVFANFERKCTT